MGRIDFHVHVTPPEISNNWRKYAEKEPYFALLAENPRNKFAAAEDVIAAMDRAGFDRAVIFGFAFQDPGRCRYVNDYVIETVKQYPDRFTGFMVLTPGAEAEREISRCHDAGLCGAGELFPEGQGWSLGDSKQTAAVAGSCAERKLPVLLHANEPVGHWYAGKTGTPLRDFDGFIENNPGLTVILAHWGGGLCFYEAMPELRKKYRNVYYDTAATPFLYDKNIYSAAAALGLREKILFGSDFPLLPPGRYMQAIEAGGIQAEDQALILGGNAARLLAGM